MPSGVTTPVNTRRSAHAPGRGVAYRTPTEPRAVRSAPVEFPWTLVAFGALLCGLGELAVRFIVLRWSPYLDGSFYLNPQAVWMGPLAALPIVLAVVTLAWLVASRSRRAFFRNGIPLGAVLFLAAFQAGLTTSRVHEAALALLALGAATQLVRWALARQAATDRLVWWSTIVMTVMSAGGGLGWNAWLRTREHAYQAVPAAAQSPNVLLLILDTVRASELSAYGYGRPTSPFLARFAAEGIRFDRALATAPWTLPSHASFFTGRYPHQLNVGWTRPLDDRFPTVAEEFAKSGFATAGFFANRYYGSWHHGLGRGFQHYSDYAFSVPELLANSNLNGRLVRAWNAMTGDVYSLRFRKAESINDNVLEWLDQRPAERPFFVFANYIDAHSPYAPPAPYRSMFMQPGKRAQRVAQGDLSAPPSAELSTTLRDAYDGSIAYLDSQLADLFRELESRGLASNTIVMITADHGEAFGEHGFLEHGVSMYLDELHVPILMRLPGGEHRGCVVRDWVTLRDVPATLTAAARLSLDTPFPGQSLLERCATPEAGATPDSPLFAEAVGREHLPGWYPSSAGDIQSLMIGNMHYIRIGANAEQLFDTATDYAEMKDLSGDPAYAETLATARRALAGISR